jgi:uncharacterized membrane protein
MTVDVVTTIVIARPLEVVADYSANPDNAPAWYVNIKGVRWVTEPPLTTGSRITFEAEFLGRRLSYTYEIVELAPRARLVMRTSEGPFPMETTYSWVDRAPEGTHMTLRNRGNPAGFAQFTAPLMRAAMARANRKDLQRLKSILESTL